MVTNGRNLEQANEDVPREPSLVNWAQAKLFQTDKLFRLALGLLIILVSYTLIEISVRVFGAFSGLVLLFTSAWLVALLLTPIVKFLKNAGLPKPLAVAVSYIIVLAAIGLFAVLVLPGLIAQTQELIQGLSNITNEIQKDANDWLKQFGLTSISINEFIGAIQSFGTEVLRNALTTITGLAGFLIQTLLVIIISASLLTGRSLEAPPIRLKSTKSERHSFWDKFPPSWREFFSLLQQSLERNLGVFLGGQITVAGIYGLSVGLVMSMTGYNYAVTTACICGLLMVIPFFGGPLSLLPPLLVAVGSKTGGPIIVVLVILFVLQTALLNVILPKLVGKQSGIGPVMTLFVLLAGAQVGGIWGVLLGVPLAGVVKNMLEYFMEKVQTSEEGRGPLTQAVKVKATASVAVKPNLPEVAETERPSQVEVAIESLVKTPED